jgi:hypothetical protein
MDTQQNIPEYIKTLPQSIQDMVFDGVWEERTNEIAKKYSLNETQTNDLADSVLLILIGLDKPDTFLENIIKELNISRLLAEQIMEDLEARVFEYAISYIEGKNKPKVESTPVQTPTPAVIKPPLSRFETVKPPVHTEEKALEIRPESLPVVEDPNKIGVPRYVPTNTYKPASSVSNAQARNSATPINTPLTPKPNQATTPTPTNAPVITYRPKSTVPEQVQQVTPVPRFTIPTEEKVENKPVTPSSPTENKINNVTTNTLEKSVADIMPPKHNIDPYREPLN